MGFGMSNHCLKRSHWFVNVVLLQGVDVFPAACRFDFRILLGWFPNPQLTWTTDGQMVPNRPFFFSRISLVVAVLQLLTTTKWPVFDPLSCKCSQWGSPSHFDSVPIMEHVCYTQSSCDALHWERFRHFSRWLQQSENGEKQTSCILLSSKSVQALFSIISWKNAIISNSQKNNPNISSPCNGNW